MEFSWDLYTVQPFVKRLARSSLSLCVLTSPSSTALLYISSTTNPKKYSLSLTLAVKKLAEVGNASKKPVNASNAPGRQP